MNVLYSGLDSLKVIESLPDETYDFIFLDPPYFTGSEFMFDSGSGSIRHMLSKEKGIPFKDVSLEEVEAEENRQRLAELKKYSDYIAKIIENAFRLLNPDGILAFLSPGKEYIDINYRLMLDQFFKSSKIITIERQAIPISGGSNNDDRLYFYAKSSNFVFPVLEEPRPIEDFKEQDDYDYYHKRDAFRHGIARPNFVYEWHGITPGQNSSWAYDKPKMNQLFDENRVLIDGNRVWIKQYRSEHLIPVSSVWKAKDNTRCRFAIDTLSLSRMFNMFVKSDSKILCPFDRGGKFSWLADSYGACWTSVHIPSDARSDLIAEIPVDHYSVITEISDETARQYTNTVITNVSDISALQSQLDQLSADIRKIQFSVGIIGDPEASVDAVIDQIHQHITELAGIKSSREYAENIRKVTNNLSAWQKTLEARLMGMYDKTLSAADSSAILNDAMIFIVAGEALFEMFVVKREYPLSDYGCIAIEYYKALEYLVNQLFYVPYYSNILSNRRIEYSEDALKKEKLSGYAGKGLERTLFKATVGKDKYEYWYKPKLEYGSFAIWGSQLKKDTANSSAAEVRNFFVQRKVNIEALTVFCNKMKKTIDLRNACAHPEVKETGFAIKARDLVYYHDVSDANYNNIKPKDIYELILELPKIFCN